ncbi:MAG: MinD/ParA family protein [Nitrospina sp.]|nr:MinD/ParA family protein [Nitrospina sp.]
MTLSAIQGRQADSLRRVMSLRNKQLPPKVLAVSSGKGGVGKTNLVANLAYSLAKKGQRVLVFDADVGLNNIDVMLGLVSNVHIGHVLSGKRKLEEVLVEGPEGIRVLPASNGWQELTTLENEQKMVLMEELDRLSASFDFLIFDTGAGISSNVTYFCCAAHETLLVATTEPTSHTDVYALMKVLFKNHQQKHFKLVVNSVKSEKEALDVYRTLSSVIDRYLTHVTLEYYGHIIQDPNVPKAVRRQKAFVELFPYSKASICVNDLCDKVISERSQIPMDGDRVFLWKSVFQA